MREGGGFGGLVMDFDDGDGEGGLFLEILGINELGRVGHGSMHHAPPVRLVFLEILESSQSNPVRTNERTNIIFGGLSYICSRSGTS